MRKRAILIIYLLAVFVFFASTAAKAASEIELKFLPPCPMGGDCQSVSGRSIAEYIVRFYQFGVGFAGILAVGMIAAGAIYKSINPGNPGKQKEGEDMMKSAIWGIVLLLGSYLILRTINPALVKLGEPVLEEIPAKEFRGFVTVPGEEELQTVARSDPNYSGLEQYCAENIPYGSRPRPDCYSAGAQVLRCEPSLGGTCVPLDPSLTMEPGQCKWAKFTRSVLSRCFVQPQVNQGLMQINEALKAIYGTNAFKINEAFPPAGRHSKEGGHYNGCSIDIKIFALDSEDTPGAPCKTLAKVIEEAKKAGFKEPFNEYADPSCPGGQKSPGWTGNHLHLQKDNCP